MDYKALLNELLTALKISKNKFAERLGLSQGNVSDWFNKPNAKPSINALKKISDVFGVNLNWLVTGAGDMFASPVPRARDHSITLPVVADIAAGAPLEVTNPEPLFHITLDRSHLALPGPYCAFRVSGVSMQPEICQDDIVVVSASYHALDLDNRICAFRTPDGLILKRLLLHHKAKAGFLYSVNFSAQKPIKYDTHSTDLTLLGVLILLIRNYAPDLITPDPPQ